MAVAGPSAKICTSSTRPSHVNVLAFDTATEWCSAALWQDGTLSVRAEHAGQRHSELLLPMLSDLLAEASVNWRQLDGLAFGMGPGSFTGLRIAASVAQGLALAHDLPVIGISTLEALAEEVGSGDAGCEDVLACLDARMGEVYAGHYRRHAQGWQCLSGPLVCPPEALVVPNSPTCLAAGSGFAAYPELAGRAAECLAAVDTQAIPHARAIARLAAPRLLRGEGLPAEAAEPLYVRDKVALKVCER